MPVVSLEEPVMIVGLVHQTQWNWKMARVVGGVDAVDAVDAAGEQRVRVRMLECGTLLSVDVKCVLSPSCAK